MICEVLSLEGKARAEERSGSRLWGGAPQRLSLAEMRNTVADSFPSLGGDSAEGVDLPIVILSP